MINQETKSQSPKSRSNYLVTGSLAPPENQQNQASNRTLYSQSKNLPPVYMNEDN